jgi:hypothetical protein
MSSSPTTTLGLDDDAAVADVDAMVREAVATCEVIDGVGCAHASDTAFWRNTNPTSPWIRPS